MAKDVLGSNPFEAKKTRASRSSVLLTDEQTRAGKSPDGKRDGKKDGTDDGKVTKIGLLEKGPSAESPPKTIAAGAVGPDAPTPAGSAPKEKKTEAQIPEAVPQQAPEKVETAPPRKKKKPKTPAGKARRLKVVGAPGSKKGVHGKRKQWSVKDYPVAERELSEEEEEEMFAESIAEPAAPLPGSGLSRGDIGRVAAGEAAAGRILNAKQYLSPRFYIQKAVRVGLWNRSDEVDEFGLDPLFEERFRPVFEWLYKRYWRVEATGLKNIPKSGRALLVANHSGVFPYDGAMISMAVRMKHPEHREVRPLVEDFIYHFPFLGAFVSRVGAVRACQENAERLLRQGALVAVFPEGIKGNVKYYRKRYQLQRFGRGGFIRLCMHTRTPIIPVAVVGAEEIHPVIARADWLGRIIGMPVLPITPTMPLLGPLGLVPLPSKWHIHFGKPINIGRYGPKSADDHILVNRLTLKVREVIQEMIKDNLKKRRSPFFG